MKTEACLVPNRTSKRGRARPRGRGPQPGRAAARLVALDSDGTVLDSMTSTQEHCFMPAFAAFFGGSSDRASLDELWRFVSLGSRLRGANRYRALAAALRIGSRHPRLGPELRRSERVASALEAWLAQESVASNAGLESALASRRADKSLGCALEWSRTVDEAVASLPPPPPFRGAASALPLLALGAELMILTSGPAASVIRDWERAGLGPYASSVAGLERGPKTRALLGAMAGRYESGRVLVVGDSPGDLETARAAGVFFFPIVPGREEESWESLASDFLPRFREGEAKSPPLAAFLDVLPQNPPW